MIELTVEQQALQALARALKAEADGNKLRRELAANLRKTLEPVLGEIRSGLMAMPTLGLIPSEGPPLRTEILKHLKVEARLSGRSTGARVRVKRRGPREFVLAARRLNRRKGWRHRVWGADVWVHQVGEPGYFDDPLQEGRAQYRQACLEAMTASAARIASRARST